MDRSPVDMAAVVRFLPDCASCEAEVAAHTDRRVIQHAQWAVVIKDCCAGGAREAHLVCPEHFVELVGQDLPAQCPSCGAISRTMGDIVDIVDTAMTLGSEARPAPR